ncbi:MAG: hypothetical protein JXR37_05685 [Kiritimatiellae bacterium]|nr:hypothetical protein [Kiritimatiellia bacterium]
MNRKLILTTSLACFFCAAAAPFAAARSVPAFPGAEGFGAHAKGGRGGKVCLVTSLADDPENPRPGTLRYFLEKVEGPRIVLFRTGGTILVKGRPIKLNTPYVTIAGHTAPGDGIAIRGGPGFGGPALGINKTHDVVVRHLAVLRGPHDRPSSTGDALQVVGSRDVVLDHLHASLATDETVDFSRASRATLQWSVVAAGLAGYHKKQGDHGFGVGVGGPGAGQVSLHHNLFAHNAWRNPRLSQGVVDVVNNVIYDPGGWRDSWITHQCDLWVNAKGNTYIPGPRTDMKTFAPFKVAVSGKAKVDEKLGRKPIAVFYSEGTITPERPSLDLPEEAAWGRYKTHVRKHFTAKPFDVPPVSATPAETALEAVLAQAGPSAMLTEDGRFVPRRYPWDKLIVSDMQGERKIGAVTSPDDLGGWPDLKPGPAPADADLDGMPDKWERMHGLDPADPGDTAADPDNDVYTNVEEYLNGTNPRKADFFGVWPNPAKGLTASRTPQDAVALQWTDQSDNEDGFRVYRRPAPGETEGWTAEWTQIAETPPDATAYVDRDAPPGTRFEYRVSAFNGYGNVSRYPGVACVNGGR